MKNWLMYIIVGVCIVLLSVLFLLASRNQKKVLDERISLRAKDKIPYGMFAAYNLLPQLFPGAHISQDRKAPGEWEAIQTTGSNQVVILTAKELEAENYELESLASFARNGNHVFIIARSLSYDATQFFNLSDNANYFDFGEADSMEVNLEQPPFVFGQRFVFPGKKYESYFPQIDTSRTMVLGRGSTNGVNFIGMKVGNGGIYIHLAPLAFSNYFLLHKNNIDYYRNVLSVIPNNVDKIVWNEFYLTKPRTRKEEDPGWFRVLMRYPSFRWGFLTAIATLLLIVLSGMRRKQRMIPEWERPKNDPMDFVKTIGRLYYDKGDHKNLAKKMSSYFLEHLRTQYKVPTHTIDEDFINTVHYKTGYDETEVRKIVTAIHNLEITTTISEQELASFHKQLESFYQNT